MSANRTFPDYRPAFEHDDYTRLITYVVPDRHIDPASDTFKTALDVRTRGFIALHHACFGCFPTDCSECQDERNTMRALNCDENGNPNDA